MSSVNANAVTGEGQFSAKQAGSEPLQTAGHQPGKLVGNDAAPEFHAQTLPAGSAPANRTFKPNNASEITNQTAVTGEGDSDAKDSLTSASDTIGGATSKDVHTGYGHPGSGQTSQELHGKVDGKGGLEARGASGVKGAEVLDHHDPKFADQRGLEKDESRSKNLFGGAPAEDLVQVNDKAPKNNPRA